MQLELCAHFLSQQTTINRLSQMLTTLAVLGLVIMATIDRQSLVLLIALIVVILLGIYETMLSIRVGFDAEILKQLSLKEKVSEQDLESLDRALESLGLVKKIAVKTRLAKKQLSTEPPTRDVNARLQACMKLFKSQILMLILQLTTLLITSLAQIILSI